MDVRRVQSNVKSIQRGVISIGFSATSQTATISAVNPAKSELRFLGSTGGWSVGASAQMGVTMVNIVLTNSTTITAARLSQDGALAQSSSWELTEFN
jgi:hypothetical protein